VRRARVVLLVTTAALVLFVAMGAIALAEGSSTARGYDYSVAVDRLAVDDPVTVPVRLPGPEQTPTRVAFVRHAGTVSAYLAMDPRYGCGLLVPADPDFDRLWSSTAVVAAFYDNCGGALYGADGRCLGGPCRRNLDAYPVRVDDGTARIDIRDRRTGALRTGFQNHDDWCASPNPATIIPGAQPAGEC